MNREETENRPSFMDNPEISDCQKQFILDVSNMNRTPEEIIEDYRNGFNDFHPEIVALLKKRADMLERRWLSGKALCLEEQWFEKG